MRDPVIGILREMGWVFLDASSHLYKRMCLLVQLSICQSANLSVSQLPIFFESKQVPAGTTMRPPACFTTFPRPAVELTDKQIFWTGLKHFLCDF